MWSAAKPAAPTVAADRLLVLPIHVSRPFLLRAIKDARRQVGAEDVRVGLHNHVLHGHGQCPASRQDAFARVRRFQITRLYRTHLKLNRARHPQFNRYVRSTNDTAALKAAHHVAKTVRALADDTHPALYRHRRHVRLSKEYVMRQSRVARSLPKRPRGG